jgi:hypothetical protein
MKEEMIMGQIHNLVPHHIGFPYSRDFAGYINCDNLRCICHGSDGCVAPSNCSIDSNGCCKWYLKQLTAEKKKAEELSKE